MMEGMYKIMSRPTKISLRQNVRKNGNPGSWKLRVSVQLDPKMQDVRIELGLGTRNQAEARERADKLVEMLEAVGLYRKPKIKITSKYLALFHGVDCTKQSQLWFEL